MNKLKLIALFLTLGVAAQAQTLQEAIKKTENERYDLARREFKQLVQNNPTSVENAFYFGNFYQTIGQNDSAISLWKQAGAINLEDKMAQLAAAKAVFFAGDTTTAGKSFCAIIKATKSKNPVVYYRIAETYATAPIKNLKVAQNLATKATELDPKFVDAYILLGDVLLEQSNSNASIATEQYNKALSVNPKAVNVIVRKAKIYQRVQNYKLANDEYKKAQEVDPTYAPAYRENAELNFLFEQYNAAIECWKKYIELNDSDEARYRYASSIFGARKYCEALPELEDLNKKGFVNLYTKRMLAYSLYECNPDASLEIYNRALAESDAFFKISPKENIISNDYKYRSLIYSKLGNDSLSIIELERAANADTSKAAEYLTTIAKIYGKAKNYNKVIEYYTKKEMLYPSKMEAIEYYELGRAYYFGPKNFVMADTSFARLMRVSPDWSGGYFWRARSSQQLDNPKAKMWLAKEFYEGYLMKLTEEEKANPGQKSFIMEASKYLGDYYVNSPEKNKDKARENWTRVQQLDPADTQAKSYFSGAGK